jgi:hypothetical protein
MLDAAMLALVSLWFVGAGLYVKLCHRVLTPQAQKQAHQ